VEVFNLFDGPLEDVDVPSGYCARGATVGELLGASEIGMSIYELAPGTRAAPYHFHHANEEWLIVLDGAPTLREPDGERVLGPGDVVAFPRGAAGAHQLRNDGDEPVRLALASTLVRPEVVEYPDSGKVGVRADGTRYNVAREPELDYWEGEA
jgi:uncharacterized cupin superfamily protein